MLPNESISEVEVEGQIQKIDITNLSKEIILKVKLIQGRAIAGRAVFIKLNVNTTIGELKNKLRSMNNKDQSFKIYAEGKELHDETDIKQHKLKPMQNIVATITSGPVQSVKRFQSQVVGWGYGGSYEDPISFQVSKSIRVAGVGMYCGSDSSLDCNIWLVDGPATQGNILGQITGVIEGPPQTPEEPICKLFFSKPIKIQANTVYTINTVITGSGSSYYGNNGQTNVDAGKVTFTFVNSQSSNSNGTSTSSGQVPEIYFYE